MVKQTTFHFAATAVARGMKAVLYATVTKTINRYVRSKIVL